MPDLTTRPKKKVRTGCITCKIRKVKCDETKPACNRCTDTGRKCDGYLNQDIIKKTKDRTPSKETPGQRLTFRPSVTIDVAALSSNVTAEERKWLLYFSQNAAPALSGPFDKDFWSQLLPQLSGSELAIRHALLAVGSSHARFGAECVKDQALTTAGQDFTIKHYNLAIANLKSILAQRRNEIELPLICCILFICLECLYGNRLLVLDHLRNGLNISKSVNFQAAPTRLGPAVKQKLLNILNRLDAQSTLYGRPMSPVPQEIGIAPASALPPTFSTIFEAQQSLETVLFNSLNFIQSVHTGVFFSSPSNPEGPSAHVLQDDLQSQLLRWTTTLETSIPFLPPTPTTANLTRILRVQHLAIFIYLSHALSTEESSYDAHLPHFLSIVELSRPPRPSPSSPSSPSPIFSLDASLIPSLFLVAVKCRHPKLRREAVRLLDANPSREGLWDSRLHGAVARRIIGIEEAKLSSSDIKDEDEGVVDLGAVEMDMEMPSEKDRVHRADIRAGEEKDRATVKVTFFMAPEGGLGEWVVWDEELDVGWSGIPVRKHEGLTSGMGWRYVK